MLHYDILNSLENTTPERRLTSIDIALRIFGEANKTNLIKVHAKLQTMAGKGQVHRRLVRIRCGTGSNSTGARRYEYYRAHSNIQS